MLNANLFDPPIPPAPQERFVWKNLHGASASLAISKVLEKQKIPVLIIAPDHLIAARVWDELSFFKPNDPPVIPFPDWETLPYDHFSPHQDIISDRLAALYHMPSMTAGAVITSVTTLMQRLAPQSYLDAQSFVLKTGDQLSIDIFTTRLTKAGYHHVSQVREHGEFAVRGSIIDLYPMGSSSPLRIDLFDNEVDSIRNFSPETQRSLEKQDAINLLPAKEFPLSEESIEIFRQSWRSRFTGNPLKAPIYQDVSEGIYAAGIEYYLPLFFDKTATLFDFLPANTLILSLGDIAQKAEDYWQEIKMRYEQGRHDLTRPLMPPPELFLAPQELQSHLKTYAEINIQTHNPVSTRGIDSEESDFSFNTQPIEDLNIHYKAHEPLKPVQDFVKNFPGRVLFCAESIGRREVLLQLFKNVQLQLKIFSSWQAFVDTEDMAGIAVAPIEEGFKTLDPQLAVISETQLYGKRVMQRRLRKKSNVDPDALIRDLTELNIGDPVVHIQHGVGRYLGLKTLSVGDQIGEFLNLEYQGGDKLYVPVASLHLISRYTGADLEHTPINKLGTDQWSKAKRRAAEKIKDVAAELLDLYAKRAARPGESLEFPHAQYASFAAAFPFEETPDQLQAIDQVFADMTSTKPMDRVICGDVGFGKTEVALRAAFLAVNNNKQVAFLVPTTLLAQQHFQNFQDRFADWPIQVEMLSRFRTAKEQKNILNRVTEGKVDILIGTHKLLQNDVQFKSLGLIIIDEEHCFGVKQKEKLKAMRTVADILTLTATPIPRTLNMALAGIRDLSVIATPPAKRLSVKTFVHEYDKQIVQEAIQREVLRGGQVYFLHNEITTIEKKAEEIANLVGEARVVVAHGQMHERDLERIMSDFYHRRYNVLVCSTIIESGIDIPTANTIIINRADKFGLAQLHQLRGRVGRSHHQAYAYLLVPSREYISADAEKRLAAITAYDDLGIGFTLATHDLEIRGAGELLGEEQSGNMHEIGFSLYMDLLSRAVDALKAGQEPDFNETLLNQNFEIDLRLPALIPENYLGDVQLRLQFYKRIANAKTVSELDEIQVEMIDRFGLLPTYLKNLFAISELKLKAQDLGILKLEANELGGRIDFNDKPNVKPATIINLIQEKSATYKLEGPTRLRFTLPQHKAPERIELVHKILDEVAQ